MGQRIKLVIEGSMMLILFFSSACTNAVLTRRFRDIKMPSPPLQEGAKEPDVLISSFAVPVPSDPEKAAILSLGDRAQSALIEAVAGKASASEDAIKALLAPLKMEETSSGVVDRCEFSRRVVFSVQRTDQRPWDRLTWLQISLTLNDEFSGKAWFSSWDQFKTQYQEIDIGHLKFSQSSALSLTSLGLDTPPPETSKGGAAQVTKSVNLGGNAGFSRSMEEETQLKKRYVLSSGRLMDMEAVIWQEAPAGLIDLTGNIVIDLKIRMEPTAPETRVYSFSNLCKLESQKAEAATSEKDGESKGKGNRTVQGRDTGAQAVGESASGEERQPKMALVPQLPREVQVACQSWRIPAQATDVLGKMTCEYLIRRVENSEGRRTWMEGDDVISFVKGTGLPAKKTALGTQIKDTGVKLVPKEDTEVRLYRIIDPSGLSAGPLYIETPLIEGVKNPKDIVWFRTFEEALELLQWLRYWGWPSDVQLWIGSRKLYMGQDPLTSVDDKAPQLQALRAFGVTKATSEEMTPPTRSLERFGIECVIVNPPQSKQ